MLDLPEKAWLRIDEVAQFLDVHPNTVRNWIKAKLLTAKYFGKTSLRIQRVSVLHLGTTKKQSKR